MRVLAVLCGVILLLPGLCSLGFIALSIPDFMRGRGDAGAAGPLLLLWLVCFAISFGGIVMIRYGVRGKRQPAPTHKDDNAPTG